LQTECFTRVNRISTPRDRYPDIDVFEASDRGRIYAVDAAAIDDDPPESGLSVTALINHSSS
jgi:hypothetical protein